MHLKLQMQLLTLMLVMKFKDVSMTFKVPDDKCKAL